MRNLACLLAVIALASLSAACGTQKDYQNPKAIDKNQEPASSSNESATQLTQSELDVVINDNPTLGKILTDGKGMALYIYTKDTDGNSVCYDACAINWPPLLVEDLPKIDNSLIDSKFDITIRTNGDKQVTLDGMPLYYWIKDKKPGDATGENVGGVWFVHKVVADDLSGDDSIPDAVK